MAKPIRFDIFRVELPFRHPFSHAAAERDTSSSLFVKCYLDSSRIGYGESLPRLYVSGETCEDSFLLLQKKILPQIVGINFSSMEEVITFLSGCNGKAPVDCLSPSVPQSAAWCAAELSLLDAFGKEFHSPIRLNSHNTLPPLFRYSPVVSSSRRMHFYLTLLKIRLLGFHQIKLKLTGKRDESTVRVARRLLGSRCDIRADVNMGWSLEQAIVIIPRLKQYGIQSFEQPLVSNDLSGLSELIKQTQAQIMVDESLIDEKSLEKIIEWHACTAVNVRLSKCGGLLASLRLCEKALQSGLQVQIGCQVGESSLLSAAHLILVTAVQQVAYGEGCFGTYLLKEDPARPMLQFGYGGHPPPLPSGDGLGIDMDERILQCYTVQKETIGNN